MRSERFVALVVLLALGAFVACRRAERTQPDILILLADDLGWRDLGFRGGPVQTPNVDRLAREGVRLDALYALPVCTPSRAALLTGRYPMRMGLHEDVLRPWSLRGLPLAERTLPEALRAAGYRTEMIGKWHLGHHEREYLPEQRGFDHHYGSYCGLIDYYTHERLGALDWHRDGRGVREAGHTTDLIADEAVRILARERDEPLFLYVAFNAPHAPNQPPQDCLGLHADVASPERRAYLAQVACLDRAIGKILAAVDPEQTLVVFLSDNGGDVERGGDNTPLRGEKGTLYEGGVRVGGIARWTGRLAPRIVTEPLHLVDWFPTLVGLAGGPVGQPLPLDGVDLWPTIAAGTTVVRGDILLNVGPEGGALRSGRWKLVVEGPLADGDGVAPLSERTELFDLEQDVSEQHDLAPREPERVRDLVARLRAYLAQSVPSEAGESDAKPAGFVPPEVWGE